jgi:hypothetical protein
MMSKGQASAQAWQRVQVSRKAISEGIAPGGRIRTFGAIALPISLDASPQADAISRMRSLKRFLLENFSLMPVPDRAVTRTLFCQHTDVKSKKSSQGPNALALIEQLESRHPISFAHGGKAQCVFLEETDFISVQQGDFTY